MNPGWLSFYSLRPIDERVKLSVRGDDGKETKLALSIEGAEPSIAEEAQVATIISEAGVGNSRLVYEFAHSPRCGA